MRKWLHPAVCAASYCCDCEVHERGQSPWWTVRMECMSIERCGRNRRSRGFVSVALLVVVFADGALADPGGGVRT